MKYGVCFIYSNDALATKLGYLGKALVERDAVTMQNLCADHFNDHYETWNKEYDETPGALSYEEFIKAKQQEIVDAAPDFHRLMSLDIRVGDECEPVGTIKPIIALMLGAPELSNLEVRVGLKEIP